MGKPKRVIVWEGDTSNLLNRNEKKNIVYANPKLDMSACIECCEDSVNPSSPYGINFPRSSTKIVFIPRVSKITSLNGGVWVTEVAHTRFNGGDPKYPNFGIWGELSDILTPGIYLMYNESVDTDDILKVTPCNEPITDFSLVLSSGIIVKKLSYELIFNSLTNTRMAWNEDNSGCITNFGSCLQIPIVFRKHKTVSNSLQNAKFSIEVIRDILENNEDALVVFCYPSKFDGSINNGIRTNFTHKTYEQLGIQDLYEKYLEQSK